MEKIMAVFILVYVLAIKHAFPADLNNLHCPPKNKQCAQSLKLTFHEIFSLKNSQAFKDKDGFLVMKYLPKKTVEIKSRNKIQSSDFLSFQGIKKITSLMGNYLFGSDEKKIQPEIYNCSITWFTKKKFSQKEQSQFPKVALDNPLEVKELEFENIFNKFGSFDHAHFVMHFDISLKTGFSDKARLSCNVNSEKFDVTKISNYFGDELSIMGVFKPRSKLRVPSNSD